MGTTHMASPQAAVAAAVVTEASSSISSLPRNAAFQRSNPIINYKHTKVTLNCI